MELSNKKRITKDIVVYENFIKEEDCKKIIKVLEAQAKNKKISWTPQSFYESYSSTLPKDSDEEFVSAELSPTIFSDIEKIMPEAIASVHSIDSKIICKVGYHAQKWETGAFARMHSDNTDQHGNPGPFERSKYAGFLYLNEDFEGGVLKFPGQDIEIKPKVGMLAVFDGGFNNMHEVSSITKGIRYTIGSFWDDKEDSHYTEEIRNVWKEEMQKIKDRTNFLEKAVKSLTISKTPKDAKGVQYKNGK
jgi:hypothetical protein